jgi:hypothetical protein
VLRRLRYAAQHGQLSVAHGTRIFHTLSARRGRALAAAFVGLLAACSGCASQRARVIDAFPPAAVAHPWVLRGDIWSGTLDDAAPALGTDVDAWRAHGPQRVWLAKYCHAEHADQCLTVRCFALDSPDHARRAFQTFRPPTAKPFDCGDAGCWTSIGVLFQWGRLVFEVFGPDASWGSEIQSAMLAGHLAKRMPPGVTEDPQ